MPAAVEAAVRWRDRTECRRWCYDVTNVSSWASRTLAWPDDIRSRSSTNEGDARPDGGPSRLKACITPDDPVGTMSGWPGAQPMFHGVPSGSTFGWADPGGFASLTGLRRRSTPSLRGSACRALRLCRLDDDPATGCRQSVPRSCPSSSPPAAMTTTRRTPARRLGCAFDTGRQASALAGRAAGAGVGHPIPLDQTRRDRRPVALRIRRGPHAILRPPARDGPGDGSEEGAAPNPANVLADEATLRADGIQDLAEQIPDLVKAAVGHAPSSRCGCGSAARYRPNRASWTGSTRCWPKFRRIGS